MVRPLASSKTLSARLSVPAASVMGLAGFLGILGEPIGVTTMPLSQVTTISTSSCSCADSAGSLCFATVTFCALMLSVPPVFSLSALSALSDFLSEAFGRKML
ncbi:hypothetical protein ES703_123588 [subsurface metagenome]